MLRGSCLSVTVAAAQQAERPENKYLGSQPGAHPRDAAETRSPYLRAWRTAVCARPAACSPVPHAARVVTTGSRAGQFAGVTEFDLSTDSAVAASTSAWAARWSPATPEDNAPEPFWSAG